MRIKLIATILSIIVSVGALGVVGTIATKNSKIKADKTVTDILVEPDEITFALFLPSVTMTLKASEQMTWERWLNSDYASNLYGFSISSDGTNSYVIYGKDNILNADKSYVNIKDSIKLDNSYYVEETIEDVIYADEKIYVTFKILPNESIIYVAEDGMTWRDFCDSQYNSIGLEVEGQYIRFTTTTGISLALYRAFEYNGEIVSADEKIIHDIKYELNPYEFEVDNLLYYRWYPNDSITIDVAQLSVDYNVSMFGSSVSSLNRIDYVSTNDIYSYDDEGMIIYMFDNNKWSDQYYIFVGGEDLDNRNLISWLNNNGTLTYNPSDRNFYGVLGQDLTDVTLSIDEQSGDIWSAILENFDKASLSGQEICVFSDGGKIAISTENYELYYFDSFGTPHQLITFDSNTELYVVNPYNIVFGDGVFIETINIVLFNSNSMYACDIFCKLLNI